jgi:hypothetical protein
MSDTTPTPKASFNYRALLNKKVAGVPVYIIGLVVAAGLLYWALKLRKEPEPIDPDAAPEGDTLDTEGDATSTDYEPPVFYADDSPGVPQITPGSVTAVNQDSDDAWSRRAIEWLVANGEDYDLASSAITRYLSGAPLSFEQGAIRDKALAQFGLPPESTPVGSVKVYNGPASKQGTPPLSHVIKGKSDDTAAELARLYYGISTPDSVKLVRGANAGLPEPYSIGASIRVPALHPPHYYRATSHTRTLYAIAKKNNKSPAKIQALNPGIKFPVKPRTRIRIS